MNKLRIETTYNIGFGTVTISLVELPLHGECRTLDEALTISSIPFLNSLIFMKITKRYTGHNPQNLNFEQWI